MRPLLKPATALVLGVVAFPACQSDPTSVEFRTTLIDVSECRPSSSFTLASTNAYYPIGPIGRTWQLEGKEGSTVVELTITVLNETQVIGTGANRVTTRVVREVEKADGVTIEISRNFFAENGRGVVCYFGEEVDIFHEDGSITHEGAWRADEGDNFPGIIMPANPAPGMQFVMEGAPDIAEDEGLITQRTGRIQVPAGTFGNTIRVRESSQLDGGHTFKTFASGVGLLIDGPLALVSCSQGCTGS